VARKRVRPLGKAIPYLGRNWVIGGTEPKSFNQAVAEQASYRGSPVQPKPYRISQPFSAKFEACNYCGRAIAAGEKISRAKLKGGRPRSVHFGCSQPQERTP
jgi:hypothetical protein